MAVSSWQNMAQQVLGSKVQQWEIADADVELRMAIIDMHSAVEDILCGYLKDKHGVTQALERGRASFPEIILLLQQHAGFGVVDSQMSERLLKFNALRNRITHEGYVPDSNEVRACVQCITVLLRHLLRRAGGRVPGQVQVKKRYSVGHSLGRAALTLTGLGFVGFAGLYALLPDLLPFIPIDDFIVGGPSLFIGLLLLRKARRK